MVQAAVGAGSDEYFMAVGTELQQQGNKLRFTRCIQSDLQLLRLELLAQTQNVINNQMFALHFLVFIT